MADSVDDALGFIGIITTIAGVMSGAYAILCWLYKDTDKDAAEEWPKSRNLASVMVSVSVIVLVLNILVPSSRTIALMIVAPAIINSEPIQKDLPEIYQMAKEALKQTLKP